MHLLKVRNGGDDNNVLFMNAEFNKQKMLETIEPATNSGNSGYVPYNNGRNNNSGGGRNNRTVSADIGSEL
jgi:hypothetical protein